MINVEQRIASGVLRLLANEIDAGKLRRATVAVGFDETGQYKIKYDAFTSTDDGKEARLIADPKAWIVDSVGAFKDNP